MYCLTQIKELKLKTEIDEVKVCRTLAMRYAIDCVCVSSKAKVANGQYKQAGLQLSRPSDPFCIWSMIHTKHSSYYYRLSKAQ